MVFGLQSKNQVYAHIKIYVVRVTSRFNKRSDTFRCDNGTEYINWRVKKFFNKLEALRQREEEIYKDGDFEAMLKKEWKNERGEMARFRDRALDKLLLKHLEREVAAKEAVENTGESLKSDATVLQKASSLSNEENEAVC